MKDDTVSLHMEETDINVKGQWPSSYEWIHLDQVDFKINTETETCSLCCVIMSTSVADDSSKTTKVTGHSHQQERFCIDED